MPLSARSLKNGIGAIGLTALLATPFAVRAAEGSAALFEEMAAVLQSPRCLNCHTNGDFPRQGDDRHRHTLNVMRGTEDRGSPGLHCTTCHQSANQPASGVPGAGDWHLAPLRMTWEGLSVGELCRAIRDPARGGMQPRQLPAHLKTSLVKWAWNPGQDARGNPRTVPPMPYDQFLELTGKWVASGAECPR